MISVLPMESRPPKVFISYSHDSPEHEARVLTLSNRLRDDGIDTILDQYQPFPPQGWIRWEKQQIIEALFVLVVCTETYCRRWSGQETPGIGRGATHESGLIQQLVYNSSGVNMKFLPVVFTEEDLPHIPLELKRYTSYVLSGNGYEDLYRLLTNQPKTQKPVLGRLRTLPPRQAHPDFRNALWNVPARNALFTGREPYLQAIHQLLTENNSAALSGIGRIGKTQTAIEYAHRFRGDYEAVLWSSVDVDIPLLSGFAALVSRCTGNVDFGIVRRFTALES